MIWPDAYNEFFSRLKGVRQSAENPSDWAAFCPAHDNTKTRALSVSVKDGRLLVKCHSTKPGAACPAERIVEAIGLDWQALFEDGHQGGGEGDGRKFVESYDYVDERRNLLFQVVRWLLPGGGKTFSQRRPNPSFDENRPPSQDNKKWLSNGRDRRRVLYRLPQLLDALDENPERWVWVVEGEKAVNRLWKSDVALVATTNDSGAMHWTSIDHVRPLAGKNVVVVEDNDDNPAGDAVKRTMMVGMSLYGLAKAVKMLRLPDAPPKGGLDDWFMLAEDTAERRRELYRRVLAAPDFEPPEEYRGLVPSASLSAALVRDRMERKDEPGGLEWLGRLRADYLRLEAALVNDYPAEEARELALRLAADLIRGIAKS